MNNKELELKTALDWWNGLPIQNLVDMNDSWVGYVHNYLPKRSGIYGMTDKEIVYIWRKKQNRTPFIERMIKDMFC